MHRRVTEALERTFVDSIEIHLPELAFHAFQAAPGGDVAKAVEYARRAGDRAMDQVAYEEAARHYEMAAQALDHASDADRAVRADLRLALALACDRSGDVPGSHAASNEAAELARAIGDPLRLGRAAIGYVGSSLFPPRRQTRDDSHCSTTPSGPSRPPPPAPSAPRSSPAC